VKYNCGTASISPEGASDNSTGCKPGVCWRKI